MINPFTQFSSTALNGAATRIYGGTSDVEGTSVHAVLITVTKMLKQAAKEAKINELQAAIDELRNQ